MAGSRAAFEGFRAIGSTDGQGSLAGGRCVALDQAVAATGAWLPALKERGIAYTTANRFIRLRQQCPQINQVGEFGSVSAVLIRRQTVRPRRTVSSYLLCDCRCDRAE